MIKVQTVADATISDMKLFAVPLLKKKPDKVTVHVDTNDCPHFTLDEMFKNMKKLYLLRQKVVKIVSKNNYFVTSFTCRHSEF